MMLENINYRKKNRYKTIEDDQQFMSYIALHRIRISDYTYREENNIYGMKGRSPIENPYLWGVLVNTEESIFLDYLIHRRKELLDEDIFSSILQIKHNSLLTNQMLDSMASIYVNNCASKEIKPNFDDIMYAFISSDQTKDKYRIVEALVSYMKSVHIPPKYSKYGNIANGRGLTEAAKSGDVELVQFLLDNGADPAKDDHWSIISAAKYGWYHIAEVLADHGANIHAKNNLVQKMIERNDKNGLVPMGSNKSGRLVLLDKLKSK